VLLDSCVVAKLIVPEPDAHLVDQLILDTTQHGGMPLALDLAAIEVANVIWKQHRRNQIDSTRAHEFLLDLYALPIQWMTIEPDLTRGFEIAIQYGVAVYDALFVAATEFLKCPGVTSDQALVQRIAVDFPQIRLL
jgi:predicted nucleic acid-binding protein